jgi:hypothetical protein
MLGVATIKMPALPPSGKSILGKVSFRKNICLNFGIFIWH